MPVWSALVGGRHFPLCFALLEPSGISFAPLSNVCGCELDANCVPAWLVLKGGRLPLCFAPLEPSGISSDQSSNDIVCSGCSSVRGELQTVCLSGQRHTGAACQQRLLPSSLLCTGGTVRHLLRPIEQYLWLLVGARGGCKLCACLVGTHRRPPLSSLLCTAGAVRDLVCPIEQCLRLRVGCKLCACLVSTEGRTPSSLLCTAGAVRHLFRPIEQ